MYFEICKIQATLIYRKWVTLKSVYTLFEWIFGQKIDFCNSVL